MVHICLILLWHAEQELNITFVDDKSPLRNDPGPESRFRIRCVLLVIQL